MYPARAALSALALCLIGAAAAAPAASAGTSDARYALANGCYALKSASANKLIVKSGDGTYAATADSPNAAEAFRMKATELGAYMLYGRAADYLGATGGTAKSQARPNEGSDWKVEAAGSASAFRLTVNGTNRALAVDGGGKLVVVDASGAGNSGVFSFQSATGCPVYPEPETNVTGDPSRPASAYGELPGMLDAHMHMMAFEFLGGRAHCARPWHRWGVTVALVDCPDHEPGGAGAVLENVLSYDNPARTHDTRGWPTFKDWPAAKSLTHEQSYYKWTERAWRGGLRLYVNLLVDNGVLCTAYPYKKNSCNEMDGVRLQARRIRELENYVDAQYGGPGKGWLRIVKSPFEARKVIAEGKLAIVLGIEVSRLFDCQVYNEVPRCNTAQIDRQLQEVYDLGVRDMELVNKFDNALAGVAGDSGSTGVAVNNGNKIETNKYWAMQTCDSMTNPGAHDRNQTTAPGTQRDQLVGGILQSFSTAGLAPLYPSPPHCNARGLTELGEYLVRRLIDKKMIIDPDHLSVRARNHLLSIAESRQYSGVVSSHSWSTPDATPRIYKLGGVITPYAGNSADFVKQWRDAKPYRDPRFYFGMGWGADMNGFGAQGDPRGANVPNPVRYPFKSVDGKQTIDKQRSGQRVYDINVDGVAHYGLYLDWVEDLRKLAGNEIIGDLNRSAEGYLQMWERADGVPTQKCVQSRVRFLRAGFTRMRLGDTYEQLLRRAGQPLARPGYAWKYCSGRGDGGIVTPILDKRGRLAVILSAARYHKAARLGPGAKAKRLRGKAKRFGRGVYVRKAARRGAAKFVYVVKRGRITHAGVASGAASKYKKRLRAHLRQAGL